MDNFIARLNIEHRKVLADEADEKRRQKILKLLAEQEAKLAAAERRLSKKRNYPP